MTDEKKPPEGGVVPAVWRVEVSAEGVHLQRLNADGFAIERYGVMPHALGAVRLAAIAHGLQPPRDLRPHEPIGAGGY